MSQPFLGELRLFSMSFVPKGWLLCAGQLLSINQNQALFSILGTTYGGDGRTTFALPDLRGRTPVHSGGNVPLGASGGAEQHILSADETPSEHLAGIDVPATTSRPQGAVSARGGAYADSADGVSATVGGHQAHENRAPFTVLTYGIAVTGIFPSRN